jgi:hypothetical protein
MPTHPQPNPIATYRAYKAMCIGLAKTTKFRMTDQAIRFLRASMLQTAQTPAQLLDALRVIFALLEPRCAAKPENKRQAELADVREWLEPPRCESEDLAEEEAVAPADPTLLYGIRRILRRVVVDHKVFYDVEWEPTREPFRALPKDMLAAFNSKHRTIVEKKFFEVEATEDNSLNHTEF